MDPALLENIKQIDIYSIAGMVALTFLLMETLKRTPWAAMIAPWEAIVSILIPIGFSLISRYTGVAFNDMHPWAVVLNAMWSALLAAQVNRFWSKPIKETIQSFKSTPADNAAGNGSEKP